MVRYLYILVLSVLLVSCSDYQKALKSDDIKVKYQVAKQMYEKGRYMKAFRLFEQIAPSYKGKQQPEAADLFYMYANTLYNTKQYYTAGYQFEYFTANYFKHPKVEEAAFLGAKSYYQLSPVYSLDQVDTYKGIDKLQAFINNYPNSQYMAEANKLVKELRTKVEKKAFEIAKQYNTIMDYKAAVKALDNFILDHPGTPYKEDALYYKYDSSYQLAINSIPERMEERLQQAKANYASLIKFNGETKYRKQADEMLARIDTELQKFSK